MQHREKPYRPRTLPEEAGMVTEWVVYHDPGCPLLLPQGAPQCRCHPAVELREYSLKDLRPWAQKLGFQKQRELQPVASKKAKLDKTRHSPVLSYRGKGVGTGSNSWNR